MNTLTKTPCPSQYTGYSRTVYECTYEAGHTGAHEDSSQWGMVWSDKVADNPRTTDPVLAEIRVRLEEDKSHFESNQYPRYIRDTEYLLKLVDGAK